MQSGVPEGKQGPNNLEGTRGVYLLHLDRPVQGGRHYCGYSANLARRIRQHHDGTGASYTQRVHRRGVGVHLVRVWPGAGKDVEWTVKHARGGPAAYCPWCWADPADPFE